MQTPASPSSVCDARVSFHGVVQMLVMPAGHKCLYWCGTGHEQHVRGAEECQDARFLFDGDIARDFEPQDQDARVAEEVAGLEGPRHLWH